MQAQNHPLAGLDYHGASQPADGACGDFFGFLAIGERRLLASIGEAPGSPLPALAVKAAIDAHFRSGGAGETDGLAAAASRLNRALCDSPVSGSILTLFCACIDPLRRVVCYLSAGHEPALLVRANRFRMHRLEPTGTVLGLTSRTVYRQRTLNLDPGDTLIAYTSGIADAQDRDGHAFGEAGVAEALREHRDEPPRLLVERILAAARQYRDRAESPAGQTVLAVRFAGSAGSLHEDRAADLAFAAA